MKTETGYIYRYTHRDSGKAYIGQTWDIKRRRQRHESLSQEDCRRFYNALKRHGVEAFDFDIICTANDQAILDALEICYINALNTLHPNGYNLTTGGNGGSPSDEARLNMSKNNARYWQGKHRSPETRRKLSEANKGKPGHPHTIETRKKISESHRGKTISAEHYRKMDEGRKRNPPGHQGKRHTAETRRKMSENNAMRRPEVRKKKSEASKGSVPWNKDKTGVYSTETRKKISKALQGKTLSDEHRKKISEGVRRKLRRKKTVESCNTLD